MGHATETLSLSGLLARRAPERHRDMLRALLTELRASLLVLDADDDPQRWKDVMHGVKGAAGTLGALQLAELTAEIHDTLPERSAEQRAADARALSEALDALETALNELC